MSEGQALLAASTMALASVFSGFGVGFLCAFFKGTETKNARFAALMCGICAGFIMMNLQIWMGYHGFKV